MDASDIIENAIREIKQIERGVNVQMKRYDKVGPEEWCLLHGYTILAVGIKEIKLLEKGINVQMKRYDGIKIRERIYLGGGNNVCLINFPNSYLLEDLSTNKNPPPLKPTVCTKPEDIWDILNQIEKENGSESLETPSASCRICKGCNSSNSVVEDQHGSIVCSTCGVVNGELLDHGPERRQYNNDDTRSGGIDRFGSPSNFFFPKLSQGTIMAGYSSSRLKRKQKWNSMVYKERSLNLVFEYINQVCTRNNFLRIIVDTAQSLYKRISDCKHKAGPNTGKQIIIRGENRISIIASCVFKSCELHKSPKSVREIAEIFDLDPKKVTKGNRQYDKIIKNSDDVGFCQMDSDVAADYIRNHCFRLKISRDNADMATRVAQNCCKMKLASDHNPQSVAAGAILLVVQYHNLNVEKKDIASLFSTSEVTITKIYNKIAPLVEGLVDDAATEHLIKKFKING